MKMRLIPVMYFGFTAMDRRFSSPMLPWIFSEIRKRECQEKLSLGVEDGHLQAYNQDFEVQFAHKLSLMTRFSQADSDPCTFLYLLRDDAEQLLYCYLYQTYKQQDVNELYHQMKEHQTTASSSTSTSSSTAARRNSNASASSNLTSLCVDISPSCSNFFEVLYIGKIKVWHKKVPDTFIDDALDKFRQHDLDKNRKKLARLKSEIDLRRGSIDSTCSLNEGSTFVGGMPRLQRSYSLLSNMTIKSPDIDRKVPTCIERISEDHDDEEQETADNQAKPSAVDLVPPEERKMSVVKGDEDELELEKLKLLMSSAEHDEHNRTMVLQVDRTDLRLISPDRKVILLHKQHRDVTTCIQGVTNSEHFGFISREATTSIGTTCTYIGFVFKCESASVASEAVAAITQAFSNTHDIKLQRPSITSCDHCPMVWFHRLCCEIENMTERKQQAAIFRRIDQLDDDEQTLILTKFRGAETDSLREQNEFLMMLLRAHCEMKQGRHVHDTAENRSEFLNQYLGGGGTIFMKAKRSLSNSFDHLLKRRGSRDDFGFGAGIKDLTLPVHPLSRESSPHPTVSHNDSSSYDRDEGMRSRSSTMSSQDIKDFRDAALKDQAEKSMKSPMIDIFMKVGSNSAPNQTTPGSWRQAIFKRVMTPAKPLEQSQVGQGDKLTKEDIRQLWKKAIHQAILLVRMEKENARIRAKQEESAVKRIKLEYEEMRNKQSDALEVWDLLTNNNKRIKADSKMLLNAIREGVPRGKRGEVWHFLAEQFCATLPPIDPIKYPTYGTPYETLLKQLTSHQHAILIDLGRTFPSHSYFSSPLGPGQLALFNLLKAYSLLDPEVGYCQGLSFVAGVLLLHMDEPSAFFLLRHLMYRRNLRNQYLPDMVSLQVKLYQLSRLLRDQLPDVYNHFDAYEVAPTLYAAPWLLTIFASQFPLGFVTRVFDLIFLEDTDVIFRVILALLTHHREAIIACDSFEDIMNYLKVKLPQIDKPLLDAIMKRVYSTDIAKPLAVYQVEYNVLQEEMQSIQNQLDTFAKSEQQLRHLQEQNKAVSHQLEMALGNVQRLEQTRTIQQSNVNKLEMHNRSMDVTIVTLGNYIQQLIEQNGNIVVPGEVRRILSHLPMLANERGSKESSPAATPATKNKNMFNISNIFTKNTTNQNTNRLMVKSLSTGKIALNNRDALTTDNVLRANSLNMNGRTCGNKTSTSAFFSSSHKDILHHIDQLDAIDDTSPTSSIDSGVDTPLTHSKGIIDECVEEDSLNNNSMEEKTGPPLSHSDINVTYNMRELKKVKSVSVRDRSSPAPDVK